METLATVPVSAPHRQRHRKSMTYGVSNRQSHRIFQSMDDNNPRFLNINDSYISNAQNIPKDVDRKDLATKLKGLRLHFDREVSVASRRKSELYSLKVEFLNISAQKKTSVRMEQKAKGLDGQILHCRAAQEEEKRRREIYLHMLDRVRTTNVHLKDKISKIKHDTQRTQVQLNNRRNSIYMDALKEAKIKHTLSKLKESIQGETKVRKQDLAHISNDLSNINASKLRKEALRNAQQEKLENALIRKRSRKAESLRKSVFLHRLWFLSMNARFENQKLKWNKLEDAFQQIKLKTGFNEISVVVERFLTKEQSLHDLMKSVREKEEALEVFRNRLELMQMEIDRIQINGNNIDLQQESLANVITLQSKVLNERIGKLTTVKTMFNKTCVWIQKIAEKIGVDHRESNSLRDHLQNIRDKVRHLMKPNIAQTVVLDEIESI